MNRKDTLRLRLMWFSEKALVFVDTRSAALAVYKETFSGPRLVRFASERFGSGARERRPLQGRARRLAGGDRETGARPRGPVARAPAFFCPLASLPLDRRCRRRSARRQAPEVDEDDLVALPHGPPAALSGQPGGGAQRVFASGLGRGRGAGAGHPEDGHSGGREGDGRSSASSAPEVTSALSAALRGLPKQPGIVDLIFGDSACAIAVRDERGGVEAIHLRLLVEGDDRAQRSIDEAFRRDPRWCARSACWARTMRPCEPAPAKRSCVPPSTEGAGAGSGDPQRFPFLSVFQPAASA